MSTKAAVLAKAKKDETKRVREQVAIFDGLLERYYEAPAIVPGVSKKPYGPLSRGPFSRGNRERLIVEVRSTVGKLQRCRQVLMDLIKSYHVDAPEVREMKELKLEIEQRMEREIQWEADLKKTPASDKALTQEVVLTLEQQKTRSALDFLSTTIEKLRRQVETDSATVERVLAKNARLRADEQEEDQEEADRAERIGELNDEREWHIERLEKIERMLLNEEADAGQALALKDMLNHFLDSNEEEGFDSDRTLYRPFGIDLPQVKEASPTISSQAVGVLSENGQSVPAATGGRPDDVRPPLKAKTELPARAPPTLADIKPHQAFTVKSKANGQEKKRVGNLRTIPCRTFAARQTCPYGDSCSFLHLLPGYEIDVREEREAAQMRARAAKTRCKYEDEVGGCKRRDCFFQHDPVDAKQASLFDVIGKKYPGLAVDDVDVPPDSPTRAPTSSPVATTKPAKASNAVTSPMLPFASIAKPSIQVASASQDPPSQVKPPQPPARAPVSKAATPLPRFVPAPPHPHNSSSATTTKSHGTRSRSSGSSDAGSISSNTSSGSFDFSPLTPASGSAGSPVVVACRMPSGLLPLGSGACLNWFLEGDCLNGDACLSRHALNPEDFAAGVLPLLGPWACLGRHLKGFCLNGSACKASHRLTESDYSTLESHQPQTNSKSHGLTDRQHYNDYRDMLLDPSLLSLQRSTARQPPVESARKAQQPAVVAPPNTRRTFTDPRMKDSRFRAGCCRFYLQGSCPYETCFDTHPKGAVDIEIEENATTFFVPDSDSEDE